ncbi:MAG: methyltransferase, partial [Pseudomonadota bacterium]
MDSVEDFGFSDPENARNYAASGPANFVPGFAALHRTTIQLLSETAGADGTVLVLGAGGGHEVKAFAEARPTWRMIAVDPAPE